MKAVAPGSSGKGFVLREEDVRRLAETVRSQLSALNPDGGPSVEYEVSLTNKSRVETSDLDQILSLENVGSHAVRRFEVRGETAGGLIEVTYQAAATPGDDPIEYVVAGENRDWVFRTKDEIEERIDRTTKATLDPLSRRVVPLLIAMIAITVPLVILSVNTERFYLGDDVIQELSTAWQSGELTDPIDAIIEVESRRANAADYGVGMWVLLGLLAIGTVVAIVWPRLSRPYHFVWGDYTERFERRQAIKQNAFWIGFVGLVVALVAAITIRFLFSGA